MRGAILVCLMLVAGAAHARHGAPTRFVPTSLGLHVASVHDRGDYNDMNPGGSLTWSGGLTVGGYYNSVRRPTWYAGFLDTIYQRRRVGLDLLVGAVTGYSDSVPLIPTVVPSLWCRLAHGVSLQVIYLPSFVMPDRVNVVHFMLESAFGAPAAPAAPGSGAGIYIREPDGGASSPTPD